LSGDLPLVDAIADPMPAFDQAASSRKLLTRMWSLAGQMGQCPLEALRKAVEDVIAPLLRLDEVLLGATAILNGFSSGVPSDAGIKAALSAGLWPLRVSTGRAKAKLDACRGFAAFDDATRRRPPIDLVLRIGARSGSVCRR
jgi:hypothetical protein